MRTVLDFRLDLKMGKQELLFAYQNPFLARFGKEFFRSAPREPGVYLFKSATGAILYVGKAKNLRNRLASYKNARPNVVSRKVLRMLRLTREIEIRVCASETDALLTENRLLREITPPFNVVNTYVDTYYFIATTSLGGSRVRFELTTNAEPSPDARKGRRLFGVFKGRGRTRDGFQSLLRALSALEAADGRFYFPTALVKERPPYAYDLAVPAELRESLHAFLHGRSRAFLGKLVERLLGNENIPRFIHHVITEDLKRLEEFYVFGPLRVRKLKRLGGVRRRALAQDEIDDLLEP
ncbi:MAG: GIY-YIG nuclease family protein [Deltaproteobacteria bacterium]|nr:GIY-YIG nuclease family protein [Deltaproteobacteria bacterium]